MKACPRCGFANLDTRDRCLKCDAVLEHRDPFEKKKVRVRRVDISGARRRATHLGQTLTDWVRPPLPTDVRRRQPSTAALLSIIPGLGQLYNHQPLKTGAFVLGWLALGWLALEHFFDPLAYPTLFAFLALWIWAAADALATAARINGQAWRAHHTGGALCAITFMLAVVWFGGLTVLSPLVYFRMIGQEGFEPDFHRGDFIWLDKWCLWLGGEPRRGELFYYDPSGFTMHSGINAFFYDTQSFIERVIGLPGETVVVDCRGETPMITVNGAPLPRAMWPLSTEHLLPRRHEFEIPEDQWLILQTRTMNEEMLDVLAGAGANPAPGLAGAVLGSAQGSWSASNLVTRDQLIGRVFAISHPPERRRWFVRGEAAP